MEKQKGLIDFILKEWLVIVSGVGVVLTSLYTKHYPVYSIRELQVVFILFILFVTVKGLHNSGLLLNIASRLERGHAIPVKLVMATFFLSMVITNDIALIVIVPLTLSLNISRKGMVVILEAMAANAGSALTPIGNPQNLFIYWSYKTAPIKFIETIIPFSLTFLVILAVLSFLLPAVEGSEKADTPKTNIKNAIMFTGMLFVVLLTVLHILPVLTGIIVIILALITDPKAFRIDYLLLLSFLFFFGIGDNMQLILISRIRYSGHIFLFSALASQLMSNVPATVLFADFTTNWKALLWGVSTGGFGSLFGSMANLIAYKFYVTNKNTKDSSLFTAQFVLIGYGAFFISIGLYFLCINPT